MGNNKETYRMVDHTAGDVFQKMIGKYYPYLAVVVALLPIMIFRDFTPANELRYLSIADESIANGRFWAFMNHGVPYADKPPLYIWIVMACKVLTGHHYMLLLSLISLIPSLIIAGVMQKWSKEVIKGEYVNASVLMLLTCGLYAGMSFFVRMDMLMSLFIVLSLFQFFRLRKVINGGNTPCLSQRILFPVWVFLAIFSKGPMGILIPLVSTTVFLMVKKEFRSWTSYWGWLTWGTILLLCLIWFGNVFIEGGTEYLDNLLVKQTVGRGVNSFHHKAPVWYYLTTLPYTLLPWTFVIAGAFVVYFLKRKEFFKNEVLSFWVVTVLSVLVLLSLISSKIQVYMLPAYPFMVYAAMGVVSAQGWRRWSAVCVGLPTFLLALAGVALGAMAFTVTEAADRWWIWTLIVILLAGSTFTFILLYIKNEMAQAIRTLSMTVLSVIFVAGFAIAEFNSSIGYECFVRKAIEVEKQEAGATPIYVWKVARAENMDVYFEDTPFTVLSGDEDRLQLPRKSVVMTKKKYLGKIDDIVESYRVGRKYYVVTVDPEKKIRFHSQNNE